MKKTLLSFLIVLLCFSFADAQIISIAKKKAGGGTSYNTPKYITSDSWYQSGDAEVSVSGVSSGQVLIFACSGMYGASSTCTPSTTVGSTSSWTQIVTSGSETHLGTQVWIYWATVSSGTSVTVSPSATNLVSDPGYCLAAYSGVATTSPVIGTGRDYNPNTTFTDNVTTDSVSPDAGINVLLVNFWASEDRDLTLSMDTGWTQRVNEASHSTTHKFADRVVTNTSGSYNFHATFGSSNAPWNDHLVLLKASTQ